MKKSSILSPVVFSPVGLKFDICAVKSFLNGPLTILPSFSLLFVSVPV